MSVAAEDRSIHIYSLSAMVREWENVWVQLERQNEDRASVYPLYRVEKLMDCNQLEDSEMVMT